MTAKELSGSLSSSQMPEVLKIKEQANAKFKESDYFSAKCLYSGALELLERCCMQSSVADQTWEGIKNNMALCDLKRKEWTRVIDTTTEILARNPSNTKALYRRGVARIGHEKLEDAQVDLRAALTLEPGNADARQKLSEVLQQVRQQQSAKREQASKMRGFLQGERLDDTVPLTDDGSVRKLHGNEHAPLLSSWLKREWLSPSSGAVAVVTCHVSLKTQSGTEVWSSRKAPGTFEKQEAGPHMVNQAKPAERPIEPVRWVLDDAWQGVFFAWNVAVKTLQLHELGRFEVAKQSLAPSVSPAIERCITQWLGDALAGCPEDIQASVRRKQALQILGLPEALCMDTTLDPNTTLKMEMELLDVGEFKDLDGIGKGLLRVLREGKPKGPRVTELCAVKAHFRIAKLLSNVALKDSRMGLANSVDGLVMKEDKTKQPIEFIVGEEDAAGEGEFVPPCIGRCLLMLPGGVAEGTSFELILRDGVPISEMEKSIFTAYATGSMDTKAMPNTSGPVAVRVEVERVVPPAAGPGSEGWSGVASLQQERARAEELEILDEGRHHRKALRRWYRLLRWLEHILEGRRWRLQGSGGDEGVGVAGAPGAAGSMYDLEWDADDGEGEAGSDAAVGDGSRASAATADSAGCAGGNSSGGLSLLDVEPVLLRQLDDQELEVWAVAHTAAARLLAATAPEEPGSVEQQAAGERVEKHARCAVRATEVGSIPKELHVAARIVLASRLADAGSPAEALEVLRRAQALDPGNSLLRDQIARAAQQDGDKRAAGLPGTLRALKQDLLAELTADSSGPRLLELLDMLEDLPLTWEAVSESAVGKEIGRCARHSDSAVADKAKALVARLHKLAKEQRPLWVR